MEYFEIISALNKLRAAIDNLNESLTCQSKCHVATAPGAFMVGEQALPIILEGFRTLDFADQADGRFTQTWIGSIAVNTRVLELAREVNNRKDALRNAIHSERDRYMQLRPVREQAASRMIRVFLSENTETCRLSLKQAYRHIPILDDTPRSIRFSYSSAGKSIKRITVRDALKLFEAEDFTSLSAMVDKKRLAAMDENSVLAMVQELPGYYKANITFSEDGNPPYTRKTLPVFLPILYPESPKFSPKTQAELPQEVLRSRAMRSDSKLKRYPTFPTLRLYEYQVS